MAELNETPFYYDVKTYEERRKEIFAEYKTRLQAMSFNDPAYPALWDERTLALALLREEFDIK